MSYRRFITRNCENCKYFNEPREFSSPAILDSCRHPEHFVPRAIIYNPDSNMPFCSDHVYKYKRREADK